MEGSPRVSALLCTLPRSGSWLLAEYLHNSDCAGTPEEYFRPDYIDWYLAQWNVARGLPIREYLRLCWSRTATDNGVFSAKLHWYQMEWLIGRLRAERGERRQEIVAHDLIESEFPSIRYIYLIRTDTALQALSWYRALQTDSWFQFEAAPIRYDERPDLQQVRWLEDIIVDHGQRWRSYFEMAGDAPLQVNFADLVQRPDPTVRQVLAHVGADYPPERPLPKGRLRRQSDEWTSVWLAAYVQARATLRPLDPSVRWSEALNRFAHVQA